jgi:ABC-2 type transport system permease protein
MRTWRQLQGWARRLLGTRFLALLRKEVQQILRDRQLVKLLLIPPTIQLLVYGFALNPDVHFLRLGVVDYAQGAKSRELVSALTENQVFLAVAHPRSERELARQVERGELTAGLVIPPDFRRDIAAGRSTEVQLFIDGVDANSAGIANGYIQQMLRRFRPEGSATTVRTPPVTTAGRPRASRARLRISVVRR